MIKNTPAYLRLKVMMSISHPEEYYIQALSERGVNYKELTHPEICAWVATLKAIEADIVIQVAETQADYNIDLSPFAAMQVNA